MHADSPATTSAPATTPITSVARPPRRWKVWLMTVGGIYPVLTVLVAATTPLMDGLPQPVRLAVIVPLAVASMVWVVTPVLSRRFHSWLST